MKSVRETQSLFTSKERHEANKKLDEQKKLQAALKELEHAAITEPEFIEKVQCKPSFALEISGILIQMKRFKILSRANFIALDVAIGRFACEEESYKYIYKFLEKLFQSAFFKNLPEAALNKSSIHRQTLVSSKMLAHIDIADKMLKLVISLEQREWLTDARLEKIIYATDLPSLKEITKQIKAELGKNEPTLNVGETEYLLDDIKSREGQKRLRYLTFPPPSVTNKDENLFSFIADSAASLMKKLR